ncbi:MAG: hypothetical protein WBA61_08260 [Aequorivita sp.]
MNLTLKNLTKLRIAGMLSEAARQEAAKNLAKKSESDISKEHVSNGVKESNDFPPNP